MGSNHAAVMILFLMGILALSQISEAASKKNCGNDLLPCLNPCIKSDVGSKPSQPDAACCKVLKKADLTCVCNTLKSLKLPGNTKVKLKAAATMPEKCGRNIPKNFKCNGKFVNGPSPSHLILPGRHLHLSISPLMVLEMSLLESLKPPV
ncbi:hypothetical protein R1flu_016020 [Riccia fluitans]|uniref:Bifunctional inhibitor/plant lipid transfer protein/seed storage helical domain-containing protein n=1 Tax=Riccia fluitans TaxID=41844 RepID=A0ABD1YLN6_9MARC